MYTLFVMLSDIQPDPTRDTMENPQFLCGHQVPLNNSPRLTATPISPGHMYLKPITPQALLDHLPHDAAPAVVWLPGTTCLLLVTEPQ